MLGERSGRIFQLAGRVRVNVARVDLETAKIDFTLADDSGSAPPSYGAKPADRGAAGAQGSPRTLDLEALTLAGMDLVLQGPALTTSEIASIAVARRRAGHSRARRRIGAGLSADPQSSSKPELPNDARRPHRSRVRRRRISRRDRVRVVAMDMDSTLITIECIDEIADRVGIKAGGRRDHRRGDAGRDRFRAEPRTPRGSAGGPSGRELERVYDERVELSPGASGCSRDSVPRARNAARLRRLHPLHRSAAARLGFDETAANTLEIVDGKLTGGHPAIVDGNVKAARLSAMRERACGRRWHRLAIGDGANDVPMLKAADISIAYHAKPVVRAQATYAIDHCGLDAVLNHLPLKVVAPALRAAVVPQNIALPASQPRRPEESNTPVWDCRHATSGRPSGKGHPYPGA